MPKSDACNDKSCRCDEWYRLLVGRTEEEDEAEDAAAELVYPQPSVTP